jgi:hypothetical protein
VGRPPQCHCHCLEESSSSSGSSSGSSSSQGVSSSSSSSSSNSSSSSISIPTIDADCFDCLEIARYWELTFAGAIDNNCTECEQLNGTFILSYSPVPPSQTCRWESPLFSVSLWNIESGIGGRCCDVEVFWLLFPSISNPGKIAISLVIQSVQVGCQTANFAPGTQYYRWEIDPEDFECLSANAFAITGGTDTESCNSLPAIITIEPTSAP